MGAACAYFPMKEGLLVAVLERGVVGGTLWIAADDEEMREVRRKYELYRSAGAGV